jgi:uncharacterized protein YegP (UPF0339 family)
MLDLVVLLAATPLAREQVSESSSKEVSVNPMRFEIVPASGGWRAHYADAKNGKLILWSQVYNDIRDARYAVALTKAYAATAPVIDRALAA